ncbi:MarR family transcriptional regulator [Arthrobacter alpinus]|nr:MarR family transcriptional regulator [Arthrobacter alpinus]
MRRRPDLSGGAAEDCAPAAGDVRLKDLAERLRIAPRSATEVVDQLEAKGLVRREADPSDRRGNAHCAHRRRAQNVYRGAGRTPR